MYISFCRPTSHDDRATAIRPIDLLCVTVLYDFHGQTTAVSLGQRDQIRPSARFAPPFDVLKTGWKEIVRSDVRDCTLHAYSLRVRVSVRKNRVRALNSPLFRAAQSWNHRLSDTWYSLATQRVSIKRRAQRRRLSGLYSRFCRMIALRQPCALYAACCLLFQSSGGDNEPCRRRIEVDCQVTPSALAKQLIWD